MFEGTLLPSATIRSGLKKMVIPLSLKKLLGSQISMNKMYAVKATESQGGHIACHSLHMMPWRMMDKDNLPEGRGRAMEGEGPGDPPTFPGQGS